MVKISIIIPVYNVEKYLKDCLDSIIKQSIKELEIICINDGSTDKSRIILEEYAQKDNRFIIIDQENQGSGIARNKGLEIATGKYLTFIDPDDWLADNAYELIYNYAEKNKSEIVHFQYKEYNEHTKEIKSSSFDKKIKETYNYDLTEKPYYNWRVLKKGCLHNLELHVWTHFYNTNFIKENKIIFAKGRRAQDHLFANSSMLLAKQIDFLNEHLYFYRVRSGSIVNSRSEHNFCIFQNIKDLESFIQKHNLLEELKEEFEDYKKQIITWHYYQTPRNRLKEYNNKAKEFLTKENYANFISETKEKNFIENLFSVKNRTENAMKQKIITILGVEFSIKQKNKKLE